MDKMLHLLETFTAHGNDGKDYAVHGYEHLRRLDAVGSMQGSWEPTGIAEYKLADGRHVDVDPTGAMSVAGSELRLERRSAAQRRAAAPSGDALVACDVCLREVPRSEALVPEACDYVAYFCGLSCFEKWKGEPERASPTLARGR